MRRGEKGVTVLTVEAGSGTGAQGPDWHDRELLRGLGVAPVRAGFYRVTVEKITKEEADAHDGDTEALEKIFDDARKPP